MSDKAMKGAYRKVLVIKPSSLGDIVHSLPFLNSLRACLPGAEIHWVVAKGLEGLLEGHPMIDRLIVINKDTWKNLSKTAATVREVRALYRQLKAERYDLAADLQGLFRSGLIAMATGAPERIGFSEAREGSGLFYTRRVSGGRNVHAVDRYLKLAEAIGCRTDRVLFPFPLFREDNLLLELKKRCAGYAVLVPGARWKTKIWPAGHFGKIAEMLPVPSLIVGGDADRERANLIAGMSGGKAVSLAGKTDMKQLISVIRDARIVVTNDSGPMHIAAAFGVPVVALFGPTSPERTGPYGTGHLVITSRADCAPCFRKTCSSPRCLEEISPEDVWEKICASGVLERAKTT